MATLTQTAYFTRKIIKYGGIAFVGLIIIRAGYITIKKILPPKTPAEIPPNVAFGKLPKIVFPQSSNLPQISYRLETISGALDKLPDQAKVYFMPEPSSSFLTTEKILTWASTIGFTQEPIKVGEFDYRFTSRLPANSELNVNAITKNFTFNYDWKNDPAGFSFQPAPEENISLEKAASFLRQAQSFPKDLTTANNKIVSLKNVNNTLVEVTFPEANFSKVNFYRQTDDGLKILPPDPKDANIYLIVSSIGNSFNGVIEAKYIHNIISTEIQATYPLRDVNLAWSQLVEGNGFVANLGNNPDGNIIVRSAYLAYYEGEKQSYLQPIIVFEGDRDFTAYVPAITSGSFTE